MTSGLPGRGTARRVRAVPTPANALIAAGPGSSKH
jgi:hypothetical protein